MPNLPIPSAFAKLYHRRAVVECSPYVLKSRNPDSVPRRMAVVVLTAGPIVFAFAHWGIPLVCVAIQQGGLAMRGLL